MTLNDIFIRAARLSGISDAYLTENDQSDIMLRALSAINTALFDICEMPPYKNLSDTADITAKQADAAVYGAAMFLSLGFGDTDKSALFSEIYNQKRAACKSGISKIVDTLPKEAAL